MAAPSALFAEQPDNHEPFLGLALGPPDPESFTLGLTSNWSVSGSHTAASLKRPRSFESRSFEECGRFGLGTNSGQPWSASATLPVSFWEQARELMQDARQSTMASSDDSLPKLADGVDQLTMGQRNDCTFPCMTLIGKHSPDSSGEEEEGVDDLEGNSKKKLRLTKGGVTLLEEIFQKQQRLTPKQKATLAKELNVQSRQVEVWFQNRRARTKVKQTEQDCEKLRVHCDALMVENRRLKQLLQTKEAAAPSPLSGAFQLGAWHLQGGGATMVVCPSCQRLSTMNPTSPRCLSHQTMPRSTPNTISFLAMKDEN